MKPEFGKPDKLSAAGDRALKTALSWAKRGPFFVIVSRGPDGKDRPAVSQIVTNGAIFWSDRWAEYAAGLLNLLSAQEVEREAKWPAVPPIGETISSEPSGVSEGSPPTP